MYARAFAEDESDEAELDSADKHLHGGKGHDGSFGLHTT